MKLEPISRIKVAFPRNIVYQINCTRISSFFCMNLLLDIQICKFSARYIFTFINHISKGLKISYKNSVFSDIIQSISFLETIVSSDILVVINKTVYSTAKSVYVSRGSKQHFRETTGRQLGNAERLCNNTFGLIGQKTAFRVGTRVYSTTSLNARSARRFSLSLFA